MEKDIINFGAMLSTDWCNALRLCAESIYRDKHTVLDLPWRTNPSGLLQEIGHNVRAGKVALTIRLLPPAPKHHPKSGTVASTVLQGGKKYMAAEVKILL